MVALKLNLGAGGKKLVGFINLDLDAKKNPDIVWDLMRPPYPFQTDSVDEVYCSYLIDHLADPAPLMQEIHRICKPTARITLIYPPL